MDLKQPSDMTDDAETLQSFFEGLNLKRKAGRIYIRFRFHSKNQDLTYQLLKNWSQANGHRLSQCIIQAESSTNIGWLVYSSQYTDVKNLQKLIYDEINIEVGFKLGAITASDIWINKEEGKKTEWKNRKKALSVHVATQHANAALSGIAKLFEPTRDISKLTRITQLKDKFLFSRPEFTIPSDQRLRYKKLVNRQSSHSKRLIAA